jgi:hypothetical protein
VKNSKRASLPTSMMVWTIHDPVIENPALLEEQFYDMRNAGFDGVAVFVRCSRYTWEQAPARATLKRIGKLCREYGLQYWAGPDPRFISRSLLGKSSGLPVVLYGDQVRATQVPHFAPVLENRFRLRCDIPARHSHIFHEVAIEYAPAGILAAYAVPVGGTVVAPQDVIDITAKAQFFYNARDRYVEAFGFFEPPDMRAWQVLAFLLVYSSHVDFSNAVQMKRYQEKLTQFARDVRSLDLLMWDEPGYTCVYGALPFSAQIQKEFKTKTRLPLHEHLLKLALDCSDDSHISVRANYFQAVQDSMISAQRRVWTAMKKVWGQNLRAGIHDTWHFESADMCDMNHGSMDLWHSLPIRSGGFIDLGGVNQLRDPDSDYYANLAAMSLIGKSLGKFSREKFAFNNLWTVGDDDGTGWQKSVMDHCVNVMALFGQRWLAHAYGPVGTIGEENTFLGSPPLPGYPHHSTWEGFPEWNRRLREHFATVKGQLPWANLLVVYPVETLYALANHRADAVAAEIFKLLLALLDHHYHIEVVSSSLFATGEWRDRRFVLEQNVYEAVIFPYAEILSEAMTTIQQNGAAQTLYAFGEPRKLINGRTVALPIDHRAKNPDEVLRWLNEQPKLRPVKAPDHAWISLTRMPEQTIVTLAPSRHGYQYEGEVAYAEKVVAISRGEKLSTVIFPKTV